MDKVQVDRRLLIGLAALALSALLSVAFLLGRASGRPPMQAQTEPAAPAGASRPEPAPQVMPTPTLPMPQPSTAPPSMPIGQPPPPAPPPTGPDEGRQRIPVAAYFAAMDRIQPGGFGGGPEAEAQAIMGSLAKGDSSGFDGLIQQAESARASMAALLPPPPCAAYHHECLADLDEGLSLMRALKAAMASSSDAQLPDLSARANALKTRSDALEREEQALRQRFGLPPKP